MHAGARTPEELETLFEDAVLVRDRRSLAALFETSAVLYTSAGPPIRGPHQIAERLLASWAGGRGYIADPQRVWRARDQALIVGEEVIQVARRGYDGVWRYAVALVVLDSWSAKGRS